ncbi:MAG: hypothetical protein KBT00_05255 [Bacteroidales bacterium]|nr:hypothetical protein [Candidatus Cacconaster merdequi]
MKYFIRALKSILYFAVIFTLIVSVLFIFSSQKKAGLSFTDMFEEGSFPKLLCFFAVFGAVYPAVSFFKRKIYINKDYAEYRTLIEEAMSDLGYKVEKAEEGVVTFRQEKMVQRLLRLFFEDRITMDISGNPIVIEGYRKDVMRVQSILSFKIQKADGPQEDQE